MAYDASPSKPKIPDGYESEDEFLAEMRDRYEEAASFDFENRTEAMTDLEFLAGEQWEPEDVKQRTGKPCLMINTLPQVVAQVVGDIRLSPPAIRVRPAEDADKDLASIREDLIRSIENQSQATSVYTNAATSQIGCGIGNFRVVLEYATNDAFDRDIVIKRIDNPLAVLWDPYLVEPTGKDARYCFIGDEIPRKVAEKLYPDVQFSSSDLGTLGMQMVQQGWLSTDSVRITEYWVIKEKPAEIVMLQDGKVEWLTKENEAQLVPLIQVNDRGETMRRKTTRRSVCQYIVTGHEILTDPVEYDISRLPIFRVPGWEINTGRKKIRFGLIRFAKDPMRMKNYWRSVQAEKLALAPRQQWLIHENQPGDQDAFRYAAESGDTVLTWAGQIKPERMDPPQIEAALLEASAQNSQDMKDVTGIHDASLGIKSNETSGRAIMARQREGDVASYIYPDNLKSAVAECGRVVNEWIPQVYDKPRTIRLLGEDGAQKIQKVNDGGPDSIDLRQGKFDIVIDTGPSYTTKRQEASESMMQFVQAVPQAAAVSADLIAQSQDWPMADEIAKRLKNALPPQIVGEEIDPNDQEAMQKAQAMQQQAQQQDQLKQDAIELQLNEQAAKVQKLHAETAKIMADAQSASRPDATPADPAMQAAILRKANAEAALAEANAGTAYFNLSILTQGAPRLAEAEAMKAEADALQAHVGAISDIYAKPLDLMHGMVDLQQKLNPPEEPTSSEDVAQSST